MRKVLSRVVLLLGALLYLASLGGKIVGQRMMDNPTPENLEKGLQWDSSNPAFWIQSARQWHFRADSPEGQRAVDAYKHSLALNPIDPSAWKELTTAHMENDNMAAAEVTLRGELQVAPHHPEIAWRMANFLLVEGRTEEAYPHLRTAANEQSLRIPVYDLAHRLGETPEVIRQQLIPETPEARTAYLQFLLSRKDLADAYPVWQDIVRTWNPAYVRLGNRYVDSLAQAGMGKDAGKVWGELLALTNRRGLREEGEFLTNRDFEARIANEGLGWRLIAGEGYQTAVDSFTSQNGAQSLRVTFDGTANLNFLGVYQVVPVEPNRRYHFEGFLKTEGITADSGLFFNLTPLGAPRQEYFAANSATHVETFGWVREQVDFRTGPNTSVIVVRLRRLPSQKLNNLMQGKVWIDHLSLKLQDS